jgi:hypothetical protein
VNDTYILFKRAGDQFIGRILAGLNIHQHTFAVILPRFCIQGAADSVSFCVFVNLLFVPFLYVMPLTNPPTCFALLQEAVTKLMERVYPTSAGTPRPLIGVLLKFLAVLCLHHDSIIEVVRGASGQGFIPDYNSLFRRPLESEARTGGYGFCTDKDFKNDVVTGVPHHVDQLVSMDHILKEQQSLGDLVKTEHTCLLESIMGALDERVSGNGISFNQVHTSLSEFTSTMIDRLGKRGGLVGRGGGGEQEGTPYEKQDGYVRYCAQQGRFFVYICCGVSLRGVCKWHLRTGFCLTSFSKCCQFLF